MPLQTGFVGDEKILFRPGIIRRPSQISPLALQTQRKDTGPVSMHPKRGHAICSQKAVQLPVLDRLDTRHLGQALHWLGKRLSEIALPPIEPVQIDTKGPTLHTLEK